MKKWDIVHWMSFGVWRSYFLDGSKLDEWKLLEPCVWGRRGIVPIICFRKKPIGWKWEVFLSVHKLFERETAKSRRHTGPSVMWWDKEELHDVDMTWWIDRHAERVLIWTIWCRNGRSLGGYDSWPWTGGKHVRCLK